MSHKGNQNLPDNKDKKAPINGEDNNENAVNAKKKEIIVEVSEETVSVKKTRSSKRLSTNKIPQDNNDSKSKKVESIDESKDEGNEDPIKVVGAEKVEDKSKTEKNGDKPKTGNDEDKPKTVTPKKEKVEDKPKTEELNGSSKTQDQVEDTVNISDDSQENNESSNKTSPIKEKEQNTSKEDFILDNETFMEPLVLQPDEPCPELEFEESSDKESEKHSPVLSRCTTRRSQNRRIPTPNTPRIIYEPEPEKEQVDSEKGSGSEVVATECSTKNFNDSDNSSANASMTVQVGGNDTRTDFSEGESELLQNLRSKGSNSASRYLSSRRSIRSLRSDVHAKSFRDSMHRGKLYIPSPLARESVERAPSVKRKDRSETPEERKKFKTDNSGFLSKLSSPLTNLKNKFSTTPTGTSTPKLTSYRDEKNNIDGDYFDQMEMPEALAEQRNKWCEIM